VAVVCAVSALGVACASHETKPHRAEVPVEPQQSKARADSPLLLENARVWGHPDADALLIAGGRIEKIGKASELRAWTASRSRDVEGGLVLPGFHDAHIHMLGGGLALARAQLNDAKTLDETLARVKQYADAHPDRAWIVGRGWSYDIVPKGTLPTAAMLDRVVADRPVAIDAYDGHTLWLNSKALALANITRDTKDPPDGTIVRDKNGNPTGALLEGAETLLEGVIPSPSRAEKKEALALAAKSCHDVGITSVDAIEADLDAWDLFLELEREGRLPLRVNVILPLEGDLDRYVQMRARGTQRVQLVGAKGFVDGIVESRTAFMKDPYVGTKEVGRPLIPREKLYELVQASAQRGLFVTLHAIGDAAVALSLDAFERSSPRLAHRVEHIEVLDPKDAARFARVGALASMQPYHAIPGDGDPDSGAWSENLGQPRLRERTFAWRTLLDAGATLVFGSDWPVFTHDPLQGLAVALTRRNENGNPPGGWNAHQTISAEQAIRAYSAGRTLAEGAPAELVVLPAEVRLEQPSTLWGKRPALVLIGE
jgi:predicted amidohydrolase YtcJ